MSLEPEPTQPTEEKSKSAIQPPKKTPTISKDPDKVVPSSPAASTPSPPPVVQKSSNEMEIEDVGHQKRIKIKRPGDASDDPFKNPNEQLPIDDSFGKVLRDEKGNPLVPVINGQRCEQKAAIRLAAARAAKVSQQQQAPQPVPSEPKVQQAPAVVMPPAPPPVPRQLFGPPPPAPNPVQSQVTQATTAHSGQPQFLLFFDPVTKQYYTVPVPFQSGAQLQQFQQRPPGGMANAPNAQGRFAAQQPGQFTYQQNPMTNPANRRFSSTNVNPQQVYPQPQNHPQQAYPNQQQQRFTYPPAQRKQSTHAVPNFSAVVFSQKKPGSKKRSPGEEQEVGPSGKQTTESGRSHQSAKKVKSSSQVRVSSKKRKRSTHDGHKK